MNEQNKLSISINLELLEKKKLQEEEEERLLLLVREKAAEEAEMAARFHKKQKQKPILFPMTVVAALSNLVSVQRPNGSKR